MAIQTVGFIGLGLIGGSLAKGLRRVCSDMKIIAYNRSRESLVAALDDGVLNQAQDSIDDNFAACDMIFLCAPVSVNIDCMKKLKGIIRPDCLLTDVGSVKTTIHEAVEELEMAGQFIGGHPMAGSELTGYANANDRLLENAYYILTPTKKNRPEQMVEYQAIVKAVGAIPLILDYRDHDRATAYISHLPHIIAYTLVNLVKKSDNRAGLMKMLAAGGFKDITRIASSSPEMWQQICEENKAALLDALEHYQEALSRVGEAVKRDKGSYLLEYFDSARQYRADMKAQYRAGVEPLYEIYLEIADEPGAIAIVSTILGSARLSIKNLEIRNKREVQSGALRIEFYDGETAKKAAEILRRYCYTVYERQ